MKIAFITQAYPPMMSGSAIIIHWLASALSGRGHQVLVICASDREGPYIEKHENLTIQRLRSHPTAFRAAQRVVLWPGSEFQKALRTFAPDIVHVHEPFILSLLAREYGRRAYCAVVVTVHALPAMGSVYLPNFPGLRALADKILWKYLGWFVRRFDAATSPTVSTTRAIAEQTGHSPQAISGGVDLQIFHARRLAPDLETGLRTRFGIPARAPIILQVGRLDKEKRVGKVIRAAARVLPQTRAHVLIVGDGIEKPALETLSRNLGIQDRVHFTGFIKNRNELADVYRLASLFVTACETETQGLVLLEAAACGLPLISADTPVLAEIIDQGVNGFLVPNGEVEEMSQRIAQILSDPEVAERMGLAGAEKAACHSYESTLETYESFYQKAISLKFAA